MMNPVFRRLRRAQLRLVRAVCGVRLDDRRAAGADQPAGRQQRGAHQPGVLQRRQHRQHRQPRHQPARILVTSQPLTSTQTTQQSCLESAKMLHDSDEDNSHEDETKDDTLADSSTSYL